MNISSNNTLTTTIAMSCGKEFGDHQKWAEDAISNIRHKLKACFFSVLEIAEIYSVAKEKLAKGVELNGRTYRNCVDGYNMSEYLSCKEPLSPRNEFFYVNDDAQIVAIRYNDWKTVFLENRGQGFGVWREPFTELRVPLLFNLRRDPFEKSQHSSNTYNDWFLDRPFVVVPLQQLAGKFLMTMKEYPPSQTPGSFNLDKVQKMIESATR